MCMDCLKEIEAEYGLEEIIFEYLDNLPSELK